MYIIIIYCTYMMGMVVQQQMQMGSQIFSWDAYGQFNFRFFFRALGKLVANKPQSWDQYLDAVMFGLRTKKQITTKFFPFMLMFGREARYLTQVPEHFMVSRHMSQYNFMSIDAVLKTWAERI